MKRTLVGAIGAVVLAAWALSDAQTTAPDAKEDAAAAARRDAGSRAAAQDDPARSGADPRVCLEFATNLEIHMCAEKYRPRKRRG